MRMRTRTRALIVIALLLSASIIPAPIAQAQWLLYCDWDYSLWIYSCEAVWWPYYQHLTTQPDFCMWTSGDTVWLKWDAGHQNVIGWYGVPSYDLTTPPPLGYEPHNFTVVGCGLVP